MEHLGAERAQVAIVTGAVGPFFPQRHLPASTLIIIFRGFHESLDTWGQATAGPGHGLGLPFVPEGTVFPFVMDLQ